MFDGCGRKIEYLRVSLTSACNLHCRYCRPEGTVSAGEGLTYGEFLRVIDIFARLGIKKVRLTGGEPLLCPDLPKLIKGTKAVAGIEEVALTTNGVDLAKYGKELVASGLDAINVSVDTLDENRYHELTGNAELTKVWEGLELLKKLPLKVKINAVPIRDFNEVDLVPLAMLAKESDWDIRFITLMPIGCAGEGTFTNGGLAAADTKKLLEEQLGELIPVENSGLAGPAEYYRAAGIKGRIGFIDALNKPFCKLCNRLRITADGFCKLCLYSPDGTDLRQLLRAGCSDELIMALIQKAVMNKPQGHHFGNDGEQDRRYMYQIGG